MYYIEEINQEGAAIVSGPFSDWAAVTDRINYLKRLVHSDTIQINIIQPYKNADTMLRFIESAEYTIERAYGAINTR